MKQRMLSIILSLTMVLSLLPAAAVTASAADDTWTGGGTEESPYQITSEDDLKALAEAVKGGETYEGKYFKLTGDIVLTGEWTPIGDYSKPFAGTFDGGCHTVSSLSITKYGSDYGLFGSVSGSGVIKNLTVEGTVNVSGGSEVGGVVGTNKGEVTNCTYTGAVSGNWVGGVVGCNYGTVQGCDNGGTVTSDTSNVGGVVGYNNGGMVRECSNSGTVTGNSNNVGGVVGYNVMGTVQECDNGGTVTGADYVGGVAGNNTGKVRECSNSGDVTGKDYVSGVVGYNSSSGTVQECSNSGTVTGAGDYVGGVVGNNYGTVQNCYSTAGTVSGSRFVGGIVGNNYGTVQECSNSSAVTGTGGRVGGVVGYNGSNNSTVQECNNSGDVKGTGDDVGGVAGNNIGTVQNCYSTAGTVSGRSYVGGVVGYNWDGTVQNCYSTAGTVSGSRYVGGVVGYNWDGTVQNCYYQSGKGVSMGIGNDGYSESTATGKTAEEIASGEVAYALQAEQEEEVWGQKLPGGGIVLLAFVDDPDNYKVYKVTFDYNDEETTPDKVIYTNAGKINEPDKPTAPDEEYTFDGWYAEGSDTAWDFGTDTVSKDITLTAKWTEKSEEPDTPPCGNEDCICDPCEGEDCTCGESGGDEGGDDPEPTPTPSTPSTPTPAPTPSTPSTPTPAPAPSTPSTPTYPPTIEDTEGGDVEVSPKNPKKGDTVTVTPTPDDGFEVGDVVVKDSKGNELEVTDNGDGTFSFTQPNGKATVKVTFVPHSAVCPSLAFTDLNTGAWYHEGVDYVISHGLMNGYGNGVFGPSNTFTRGMLAQLLYNLEGSVPVNYLMQYDDVPAGAWYAEAVRWATSEGIVSGYGNNKFGPGDSITREQLAVMLYRYKQSKFGVTEAWVPQLTYNDAAEVSDWAYDAMGWCVMNGIIEGKGNGILAPKGKATRAEVAVMLMRFLSHLIGK